MATTVSTLVPTVLEFPYIRPGGESETWSSNAPRAEKIFSITGANNVTAAAGGEDQRINTTLVLPKGFAYVLVEFHATLFGLDDIADWDPAAFVVLKDTTDFATVTQFAGLPCEKSSIWHVAPTQGGAEYTIPTEMLLKKTVIPHMNNDADMDFALSNIIADGGVMTFRLLARFLVYDINQAHHYEVNAPVPIR